MRILISIIFFFIGTYANSQEKLQSVFSFDDFIKVVLFNHPIAKQAQLKKEEGLAYLMKARGAFDPKLYSDIDQKEFNDVSYYFLSNSGLKVPTWFGIEVKAGYEYNDGKYVDGQNIVPGSGLWYAGISVPVGKNLFIDERRAALKQSKVMVQLTDVQKKIMLNELIFDATQNYWNWLKAYQKMNISREGVRFSETRLEAMKIGMELKEYAMIDTVEASVQLQDRKLDYEKNYLDFINYTNKLSSFLWTENETPLEISENLIPQNEINQPKLELNNKIDSNFFLLSYDYKIKNLEIERKLKLEMLKPQIDLQFNPLLQPTRQDLFLPYNVNNFKFGLQASFPIFIRKERGDLKLTNLKLKAAQLERNQKELEIQLKIQNIQNQISSLVRQLELQEKMVSQYLQLRDAEQLKFEIGESTLFLTNVRELKYLESKQKLIELKTLYVNTNAELIYQTANIDYAK